MSEYFEPFEATNKETNQQVRFFDRYLKERKSGTATYPVYIGEQEDGQYVQVPVFVLVDKFQRERR